ncbi:hypothetical protein [Denitrobaculum tricleocarpae]|uniref:Uncharacterized protein n=1 Tax=Denitrobaculum tricleocarpae TaxID=2591009 RepID=A0A545SYQ2_9PROT|nr:hypothetical protein [Denitrobaculum tricleocarpae]TQV70091.1 hypothetical protein FKG95_28425 [Denitrobaculum tricleocarpae]
MDTLVDGIAAIAASLEVLKEMNEIDQESDLPSVKLKIAELTTALASVQVILATTQQEIASKDETILTLQQNLERQKTTIEREGFLYDQASDGSPEGAPYCPRCHQKDGVMMRLTESERDEFRMECPECKATYAVVARSYAEQRDKPAII